MAKKQNTDIGDFPVTVIKTTKPNVTLDSMGTRRSAAMMKKVEIRNKRHRNAQVRVGRLIKDVEES